MVSTIDKIRDTTIWRTIRKLAGVVDEQNATVENVQEQLNNFNLDGVNSDIANLKASDATQNQKLEQLRISDDENTEQNAINAGNISNINGEITTIKSDIVTVKTDIDALDTNVTALNKELPTEYVISSPATGSIKLTMEREDSTSLESNTLDLGIPVSYTIVSGTTARTFRLKIGFSNGDEIITNDFVIPEGGGTDVSVTSVALKNVANKLTVEIGLSDGTPITSNEITIISSVTGTVSGNTMNLAVNGFSGSVTNLVNTVGLSYVNNKLKCTVNGVASDEITIDTTGTVYEAGPGIVISNGYISADISTGLKNAEGKIAVDTDVIATKSYADSELAKKANTSDVNTELAKKANQSALDTTNEKVTQCVTAVGDCFNAVAIGSDGKSLDFTATDGQVNNIELPSLGGSEWIELDFNNLPTDFAAGDKIFCIFKDFQFNVRSSSWTSSITVMDILFGEAIENSAIIEITGTEQYYIAPLKHVGTYVMGFYSVTIDNDSWNTKTFNMTTYGFNGNGLVTENVTVLPSKFIYKVYRLKK